MASRESCFEGTRVKLIEDIMGWLNECDKRQSIYVLRGVAGIGKSTVSKSVAEHAVDAGNLVASFFFSRNEKNRKTARSIFPTLAHQLATNAVFGGRLTKVLQDDLGAAERDLQRQFSSLLAWPLRPLMANGDPILLIIDALDECDENDATTVLKILAREVPQLRRLKVFITTRPERCIRHELEKHEGHEQFRLEDIEQSVVQSDIRHYLSFRFSKDEVCRVLPELPPPPWQPTPKQMGALVRMSDKLFIIAFTAATFILDEAQLDPAGQLNTLLSCLSPTDFSGSQHTFLDDMYMQIIRAACPKSAADSWMKRFRVIVGTITLLQDPLPCKALADIIGISANDIERTLANLHSLLPLGKTDQIFRIHHKSFPDFITDPGRREVSGVFYIDRMVHHLRIAKRCLTVMNSNLKRYSEPRDKDQMQPHRLPQDDILPHLRYACIYWASHLGLAAKFDFESPPDAEVKGLLECFTSQHSHAWVKVLSSIRGNGFARVNIDTVPETWVRSVYCFHHPADQHQ